LNQLEIPTTILLSWRLNNLNSWTGSFSQRLASKVEKPKLMLIKVIRELAGEEGEFESQKAY
jgi:hypothetical protein